jgi:hypothetical protein
VFFLHYSKLILTTQKRQSFLYAKYENTAFHINKSSIQEFSLFILNRVHGIGGSLRGMVRHERK